ncbi:MAG: hypothetical protein RLY20_2902, partial [Verrucomicrobiota bacterium]
MRTRVFGITLGLLLVAARSFAAEVDAATKPGEAWKRFETRTLSEVDSLASLAPDAGLDRFGGLSDRKAKATGFFRVEKIDGRWWLVDPNGGLFIHRGLATVRSVDAPKAQAAFDAKFGSLSNWAAQTSSFLREHGFTSASGWSDVDSLRHAVQPPVYARMWSFMANYARKRGGTFQQPGHMGYSNDCIFVFDPEFETVCDEYAKQLTETKDDPWLIGHFSDNEMPLPAEALRNYLKLPVGDPGRQAAAKFLQARHGADATLAQITTADEAAFQELAVGRYFEVVSR